MKKVEIRSFGVFSLYKLSVYLLVLPMLFVSVMGLFFAVVGGIMKYDRLMHIGVAYLIFPVILILFCAVVNILIGFVYNGLAGRFGGLEMTVRVIDDETPRLSDVGSLGAGQNEGAGGAGGAGETSGEPQDARDL